MNLLPARYYSQKKKAWMDTNLFEQRLLWHNYIAASSLSIPDVLKALTISNEPEKRHFNERMEQASEVLC